MATKKISDLVNGDRIKLDDERVGVISSVERCRVFDGRAFMVKWTVGPHRGKAIHGADETVALA